MKESNSKSAREEMTPSMYALSSNSYSPSSIPATSRRTYLRAQRLSAIERVGLPGLMLLEQLPVYADLDQRVKFAIKQKVLQFISGQNIPSLHQITEFILKEASEVEKQLGLYVPGELTLKADSKAYILYEQIVNGTHAISAQINELLCDDCKYARCMHPHCGKEHPHRMEVPTLKSTPSAKIGIPNPDQIPTISYRKLYGDLQAGNHKAYVLTSEFWRRLQTGDFETPFDFLKMISNEDTPSEWIIAFKQLQVWHLSRQSRVRLINEAESNQKSKSNSPSGNTSADMINTTTPTTENNITRAKKEKRTTRPEIPLSKYPNRLTGPKKAHPAPAKAKGIASYRPISDAIIDINSLIIGNENK